MFKKKEKSYEFNSFGYAQCVLDTRKEKQDKMNNITSFLLMGGLFAFGLLSKEFLMLYLGGKAIEGITNIFIG